MNDAVQLRTVRPVASEIEISAIDAALVALWPKPQVARRTSRDSAWRFSGRATNTLYTPK